MQLTSVICIFLLVIKTTIAAFEFLRYFPIMAAQVPFGEPTLMVLFGFSLVGLSTIRGRSQESKAPKHPIPLSVPFPSHTL